MAGSVAPPLPPGFTLDPPPAMPQGASPAMPPLPPGFTLDAPPVMPTPNGPAPPLNAVPRQPEAAPTPEAPKQPLPTAVDAGLSFGSGALRGAAETLMLPLTVPRLLDEYVIQPTLGRAADAVVETGDDLVRFVVGAQPANEADRVRMREKARENVLYDLQDASRAQMNDSLYQPQTTTGEYARTVGEFAVPGALLGKGTMLSRAVGDVLVPAIASETAGQITEGSPFEGAARFAGALAGSGIAGLGRSRAVAGENAARDSLQGITPQQWDEVKSLVSNNQGINVSVPNAVDYVTKGANEGFTQLQRTVESIPAGKNVMAPFFAQVPDQTRAAVDSALDTIAPRPTNPSLIGSRAAATAQDAIDTARQGINAETSALYKAAEPVLVADDAANAILSDAVVASELKALRADPIYAGLKDLPDNSVGVFDALKKRLDDFASAAQRAGRNNEASQAGARAEALRNAAANASPDYRTALNIQASRRQDVLAPLEQGPIGRAANAGTPDSVLNAVLPKSPAQGSEIEVAKTLMAIGEKNPDLAASLVRQVMGDAADASLRDARGLPSYGGGQRFVQSIAGTDQQRRNLEAAFAAIPTGDKAAAAFGDLLPVLRANARRMYEGSPTASRAEAMRDLGTGSAGSAVTNTAMSAGTNIPSAIREAAQRFWLGKNAGDLASMFTTPEGLERLRRISETAAPTKSQLATPAVIKAAPQTRDRNKERK